MNKKTLDATFGEVYYAPECEDIALSSESVIAASDGNQDFKKGEEQDPFA